MEGKNLLKAGLVITAAVLIGGIGVVLFEQHVSKTKPKTEAK